ncbi:hypothetical protein [Desulfosporosinus lacus]|uniref:ABC-2 type transport system permease protein n=1 Tax=Desulfosporosinus lacus DSM 15449 TaxID=1121420 RepID=A0A1M5S7B5_9FIRM|nr:hypothetical protein [Desulfosporosinus lacus]SHH34394.1 hypothetical protein SAMN02746098_00767 [Desulfosporosinus lacus DSM 15449]
MVKINIIAHCCAQNLRKLPANPRCYVLGLFLIGVLAEYILPISNFSHIVQIPATPWVFPYLALDPRLLALIMLGIVFLFCDAPFIDSHQPYVIIRSGKKNWLLGQIAYIIVASAIYFMLIFLVSVLFLLPNITFSSEWGKVLGTLGITDAGNQFNVPLGISYALQLNYSPIAAMAWSLLMAWLVGTFLGLLIFVLNMRFTREIGVVVSTALVFLQYFCFEAGGFLLYSFSPVSWANLNMLDTTYTSALPSVTYAVSALISLSLILILLTALLMRKKDIDVLPPV